MFIVHYYITFVVLIKFLRVLKTDVGPLWNRGKYTTHTSKSLPSNFRYDIMNEDNKLYRDDEGEENKACNNMFKQWFGFGI